MALSHYARPTALHAVLLLACLSSTYSYPSLYVARYAGDSCTAHPTSHFGKVHDYTSTPDKTVSFKLVAKESGKALLPVNGVSKICSGTPYYVTLSFGEPSKRNYLLTSSHGAFEVQRNDCDAWCPNRVCSAEPASKATALFTVPCSVAGDTKVTIKLTSSNGRIPALGSTLRSAAMSLHLDSKCGKCGVTQEKSKPK